MKKWSLDALYTSFESKEFQDSLLLCEKLIEELHMFAVKELQNTEEPVRKIIEFTNQNDDMFKDLHNIGIHRYTSIWRYR